MSMLPTSEIRQEESVEEYMRDRYESQSHKASSLYGKIILGVRADGHKEICKMSNKEKLRQSRGLEDPVMEIHVMRELHGCDGHVQLIDALQDDQFILMVIQFIPDGDMYDYISTSSSTRQGSGGVGLDLARNLIGQLCRSMVAMHERGFCHLDISLENILIDRRTQLISICDYGLSRSFNACSRRFHSNRIRAGKKGYLPPEIICRAPFDGELVDVWAVAVVFWILLTGHPPFVSASSSDVRFEAVYNRDCALLLRRCKLIDFVPEKERRIFNAVFVEENNRISMTDFVRMIDELSEEE